jgi:hypothetical protein
MLLRSKGSPTLSPSREGVRDAPVLFRSKGSPTLSPSREGVRDAPVLFRSKGSPTLSPSREGVRDAPMLFRSKGKRRLPLIHQMVHCDKNYLFLPAFLWLPCRRCYCWVACAVGYWRRCGNNVSSSVLQAGSAIHRFSTRIHSLSTSSIARNSVDPAQSRMGKGFQRVIWVWKNMSEK